MNTFGFACRREEGGNGELRLLPPLASSSTIPPLKGARRLTQSVVDISTVNSTLLGHRER